MLKRPCDICRSKERDPARTKTCRKGHYLCSVCHNGRHTCPLCTAPLELIADPRPSLPWLMLPSFRVSEA